jgi:hypothetical protein
MRVDENRLCNLGRLVNRATDEILVRFGVFRP